MNNKNNLSNKEKINKEYLIRKNKLITIKENNLIVNNNFKINNTIDNLCKKFRNKNTNFFLNKKNIIKLAGRIIIRRIIGKITFLILQDIYNYIQIYINSNIISEKIYIYQNKLLDIGDIVGVEGKLFKTKTNELSINCNHIYFITKCLNPISSKYYGLNNNKIKYKNRYLDLIYNSKSRKTFLLRSKILNEIRFFLNKRKFIEVETPIIQLIPGGAEANPFITKYNNLNKNLYLRIAPEIYLKKLLIGGFNKIFEIGKNFRNEGISPNHNPEFTTIELYITYHNFKYLINLTENIIKNICKKILNNFLIKYENITIDFSKKFNIINMIDSIYKFNNLNKECININNITDCLSLSKINGIFLEKKWSIGRIQYEIFKKTVEKKIIDPTFITEYPIDVSPLSKRNNVNKNIADRFELFICGLEICNGFSELNDPYDQNERFINQIKELDNKLLDKNYIYSMKYGLPPSSGVGIGLDRLIMIFTNNSNIRDVILFPNIRYK